MSYNYMNAMTEDIRDYITENINREDYTEDRDGLEEYLNDTLWTEDSVTGNASGSYTFNRETAKEYVLDNTDLLKEAYTEFGQKENIADVICDEDWESADVTIRCYLLGQAIAEVLDDLDSDGYFDSTNKAQQSKGE
jgi:hypothetical protein